MPEQPHAPRARPQLCSSSSTSISQSPTPSKAPLLIIHNNLHAPIESRTRIWPMPAGELQLSVNCQSTGMITLNETTFSTRFRIALHHECHLRNGHSQVIRTQNRSRIALDRKHKQYWIARRTTLQLFTTEDWVQAPEFLCESRSRPLIVWTRFMCARVPPRAANARCKMNKSESRFTGMNAVCPC